MKEIKNKQGYNIVIPDNLYRENLDNKYIELFEETKEASFDGLPIEVYYNQSELGNLTKMKPNSELLLTSSFFLQKDLGFNGKTSMGLSVKFSNPLLNKKDFDEAMMQILDYYTNFDLFIRDKFYYSASDIEVAVIDKLLDFYQVNYQVIEANVRMNKVNPAVIGYLYEMNGVAEEHDMQKIICAEIVFTITEGENNRKLFYDKVSKLLTQEYYKEITMNMFGEFYLEKFVNFNKHYKDMILYYYSILDDAKENIKSKEIEGSIEGITKYIKSKVVLMKYLPDNDEANAKFKKYGLLVVNGTMNTVSDFMGALAGIDKDKSKAISIFNEKSKEIKSVENMRKNIINKFSSEKEIEDFIVKRKLIQKYEHLGSAKLIGDEIIEKEMFKKANELMKAI